ncbi:MAG TPA: patatin-like phospholipase family protein [Chitinophagaceae bacterium]|nr:patatin-like phospholipase family protein [Chitinophagaceae bacterium]
MNKIVCVLVSVASTFLVNAQPPREIKNLVFEAAGIRGIAYCGAIKEMESMHLMNEIEKVAGTSSGAIMALAVSLGYTGDEIEKLIGGTNFKKFNDGNFLFFGGISRAKNYFGWYKGKKLEKWLGQMIELKTGNADITFDELHQKGFKDLYVTGTSLTRQRPVIFSHESYPAMKVKDAVRISASIPLYFEAVFMDSTGNILHHPKQKQGLDVMVDGGFLENFPIHVFDDPKTDLFTLGFRIDPDVQIKNDRRNQVLADMPVNNLKEYMLAFYNVVIENLNRQQLKPVDWERTVSISDGDISPKIRKLSKEEVNTLIENGRDAVKNYLN